MKLCSIGRVAAAAVIVLCANGAALFVPASAAPPQPLSADDCKRAVGANTPTSTWALNRLQINKVNSITRGRDVRSGAPVRVAVIDSGLDLTHPQLRHADIAEQVDAITDDNGKQFRDCYGHGTQVAAIIAAQPDSRFPQFVGVAPEAEVLPIKVTNGEKGAAAADIARAIDDAVSAKARVINLSLTLKVDVTVVRDAVARAQRAGVLLVAAAGNDNQEANKGTPYPAAYATKYDNVLGVTATTSANAVSNYSQTGPFVGIAAPGDGVQTVGVAGGYIVQSGTSFAAPFVTGIAALTLAANPGLDAKQLRDRIEATAESPPATVPSQQWGYGIIDPYLAVTSRSDAPPAAPSSGRASPIPAAQPIAADDRTLQHVAVSVALGMLGLGLVVVLGAVVLRSPRRATIRH